MTHQTITLPHQIVNITKTFSKGGMGTIKNRKKIDTNNPIFCSSTMNNPNFRLFSDNPTLSLVHRK